MAIPQIFVYSLPIVRRNERLKRIINTLWRSILYSRTGRCIIKFCPKNYLQYLHEVILPHWIEPIARLNVIQADVFFVSLKMHVYAFRCGSRAHIHAHNKSTGTWVLLYEIYMYMRVSTLIYISMSIMHIHITRPKHLWTKKWLELL